MDRHIMYVSRQISNEKFGNKYLAVLHQYSSEMLLDKGMELKKVHNTLDTNFLELTQNYCPGRSDLLRLSGAKQMCCRTY